MAKQYFKKITDVLPKDGRLMPKEDFKRALLLNEGKFKFSSLVVGEKYDITVENVMKLINENKVPCIQPGLHGYRLRGVVDLQSAWVDP